MTAFVPADGSPRQLRPTEVKRLNREWRRDSAARLALLLDPEAPDPLAKLADSAGSGGQAAQDGPGGEVVLIVGPEGGIAPAEAELLARSGATGARLGPTVLRASTAGAVAAALVLSASGRWA